MTKKADYTKSQITRYVSGIEAAGFIIESIVVRPDGSLEFCKSINNKDNNIISDWNDI